jgi:hypothetical protein
MERRQAMAWAGSIALFGCVSALLLGSLAGGFGFDITQTPQPQAIGPGPQPPPSQEPPARDSAQAPPLAGSPLPDAVLSDPEPAPASASVAPARAAAPDVEHYPHAPTGHAQLPVAFSLTQPISPPSATAGSRAVPPPPRNVAKPNAAPEKKAPAPIPGKAPPRDIPNAGPPKRPIKNARPEDRPEVRPAGRPADIDKIIRSKIHTFMSPGTGNVLDRMKGAGTKAPVKNGKARGQGDRHGG